MNEITFLNSFRDIATTIFLNFSAPITFLGFCLWIITIFWIHGDKWKATFKVPTTIKLTLASLIATSIIFLTHSVTYKVLSDETNLLSVANMITLFQKASNTTTWLYYYGSYHPIDIQIPTRPLLFPILTSFVQRLVGFREQSPFIVNFISLFFLYFLVLKWALKTYPSQIYWVAYALLMNSALAIYATSAGYDLVSLTMGFVIFLQLQEYFSGPEDDKLRSVVLGCIAFATVRYESIVLLVLFLGYLLITQGPILLWKKISSTYVLIMVLLLIPTGLQRILTFGQFENPPGIPPFSFQHFLDHFPTFLHSFFIDINGPYPAILHTLGILSLGKIIFQRKTIVNPFLGIIATFFIVLTSILLSHHFGWANHPTQARLFLPLSLALSLLAIPLLADLSRALGSYAITLVMLYLVFFHNSYSLQDTFMTGLTGQRMMAAEREFLAKNDDKHTLHVYHAPGQISAFGYSAVGWRNFADRRNQYLENIQTGVFQKVLLWRYRDDIPSSIEEESILRTTDVKMIAHYEIAESKHLEIYEVLKSK